MSTPLAALLAKLTKYANEYKDMCGTSIRVELVSYGSDNHCVEINIRRKYSDLPILQINVSYNIFVLDSFEGNFEPVKLRIENAINKLELEYIKVKNYEQAKLNFEYMKLGDKL